MPHLHLDRNVEFAAFRIEWIILAMVGLQLEPMRIGVGADEPKIPDRPFEASEAFHPLGRIDAGKAMEAGGMGRDGFGDPFIRHMPGAGGALLAQLASDEERFLDAGGIHLGKHLVVRDRRNILFRAADLLGVERLGPRRARRYDLWCQRIHNDINDALHRIVPLFILFYYIGIYLEHLASLNYRRARLMSVNRLEGVAS
ncbi:hypothetical protein CHELA20_11602 [Hyphomicrobiales bacterium]|nr:hypothetical protein CHELA20_11602 [Hyphomicrobiales bacterium]CAH1689177.1 hypothetical protein CHELA41_50055 [Hyphomicrobiales bacterium]